MQVNWDEYCFRCHSLAYIMADPKGKSFKQKYDETLASYKKKSEDYANTKNKETKTAQNLLAAQEKLSKTLDYLSENIGKVLLSDTCKNHLADVYTYETTGRSEFDTIQSKYLEKGLNLEEDAITAYCLLTGNMHRKNKERRSNGFISGENDFHDEDTVYDAKVNWSIYQYNRVAVRPIKPLYHWQLEGYMWLWDKPKGRLVYALLDTPEKLILSEEKRMLYYWVGSDDDYKLACEEIRHLHTYGDLDPRRKVRIFDVTASEERREKIKKRVVECREFLKDFDNYKFSEETDDGTDMDAE